MHFDLQQSGGEVRGGGIRGVGHAAVGALGVPPCVPHGQGQTVPGPLDLRRVEAPGALPHWTPAPHVLQKENFIQPDMQNAPEANFRSAEQHCIYRKSKNRKTLSLGGASDGSCF